MDKTLNSLVNTTIKQNIEDLPCFDTCEIFLTIIDQVTYFSCSEFFVLFLVVNKVTFPRIPQCTKQGDVNCGFCPRILFCSCLHYHHIVAYWKTSHTHMINLKRLINHDINVGTILGLYYEKSTWYIISHFSFRQW